LALLLGLSLLNCFQGPSGEEDELADSVLVRVVFKLLTLLYYWFCFLVLSYLERNKQFEIIELMEQM